eukprot:tig00000841_g4733.t1
MLDLFVCPSFPTIAGEGPNGAIIHYRAEEGRCGVVGPDSMLLLDSGGQYRRAVYPYPPPRPIASSRPPSPPALLLAPLLEL